MAKAYGSAKGGTGRLMTLGEVEELGGTTSGDTGSLSGCPDWIRTGNNFWLGTAYDLESVWVVRIRDNKLMNNTISDYFGDGYGVRPVLEISKSLIS